MERLWKGSEFESSVVWHSFDRLLNVFRKLPCSSVPHSLSCQPQPRLEELKKKFEHDHEIAALKNALPGELGCLFLCRSGWRKSCAIFRHSLYPWNYSIMLSWVVQDSLDPPCVQYMIWRRPCTDLVKSSQAF